MVKNLTDFEMKLCKRIEFLCKKLLKKDIYSGQWSDLIYVDETGIQVTLALANFPDIAKDSTKSVEERPLCWPSEQNSDSTSCPRVRFVKKDEEKYEGNNIFGELKGNCNYKEERQLAPVCTTGEYKIEFQKELSLFEGPTVIVPCSPNYDIREILHFNKIEQNCDISFSSVTEKNYVEIKYPRVTYTGDFRWLCQNGLPSKEGESLCSLYINDGDYGCFDLPILKKQLTMEEGKSYITDCGEGRMIVDLIRLLNVVDQVKTNRYFVAFFRNDEVPSSKEMEQVLDYFLIHTKKEMSIKGLLTRGKSGTVHLHGVENYKNSSLYFFTKENDSLECVHFNDSSSSPQFKFLIPSDLDSCHLCALLIKILP